MEIRIYKDGSLREEQYISGCLGFPTPGCPSFFRGPVVHFCRVSHCIPKHVGHRKNLLGDEEMRARNSRSMGFGDGGVLGGILAPKIEHFRDGAFGSCQGAQQLP